MILDHIINEINFCVVVVKFFRWVTGTSMARPTLNVILGRAIVLLIGVRMYPFTIVFVVNTQPGLSKET
jgi:hypothetical protein